MAATDTLIEPIATPAPPTHRGPTLKVLSLNLAHGRNQSLNQMLVGKGRIRENLEVIARFLNTTQADVVAFQEADGPARWSGKFDHIALLATQADYPARAHTRHAQNWLYNYGTALLSKTTFTDTLNHTFAPTPPTTNKGFTLGQINWQTGATETDIQLIDILSVHLDFSRKSVREQQIAEIIVVLDQRDRPTIIMGDFNSDWLAEDAVVRKMAEEALLHTWQPEALDMGTYPRSEKRLDWILISQELEFVDYTTLPDKLSDHLAIMATIRFKKSAQ